MTQLLFYEMRKPFDVPAEGLLSEKTGATGFEPVEETE
jgi:hypothetical protein